MGLFRKKRPVLGTVCTKCGMKFSEPERLFRHMLKAHKRKKFQCDSCGFRN